jgi:uncharacterized protein (TIGR02284 family)
MSDDPNLGTIRSLVDACHRSAGTYIDCARRMPRPELAKFLEIHANGCLDAAQSLASLIGEQTGPATVEKLRADGSGRYADDELALLEVCEKAADEALDRYEEAVRASLPPTMLDLVASQREGAQRTHDQIRALRDRALADHEAAGLALDGSWKQWQREGDSDGKRQRG